MKSLFFFIFFFLRKSQCYHLRSVLVIFWLLYLFANIDAESIRFPNIHIFIVLHMKLVYRLYVIWQQEWGKSFSKMRTLYIYVYTHCMYVSLLVLLLLFWLLLLLLLTEWVGFYHVREEKCGFWFKTKHEKFIWYFGKLLSVELKLENIQACTTHSDYNILVYRDKHTHTRHIHTQTRAGS